jgi:uncharacterized protein YecE (DUF72 family)
MKRVWIGCSGWNYDDWRGRLYPQREPKRRWLTLYAARFDTVEVNATFYRLPTRNATAGWVSQTPDGFRFAVKASRYLTHVKRLAATADGIRLFYDRLEPLIEAGRLGPILWQLPENFHRDDERLSEWLTVLPDGRHTIEFHPNRPFQSLEATASWRYVRFHYGARGRGGNYSATELREWARRIAAWRRSHEVYAYFNNDWRGYAPANALALKRHLSG